MRIRRRQTAPSAAAAPFAHASAAALYARTFVRSVIGPPQSSAARTSEKFPSRALRRTRSLREPTSTAQPPRAAHSPKRHIKLARHQHRSRRQRGAQRGPGTNAVVCILARVTPAGAAVILHPRNESTRAPGRSRCCWAHANTHTEGPCGGNRTTTRCTQHKSRRHRMQCTQRALQIHAQVAARTLRPA